MLVEMIPALALAVSIQASGPLTRAHAHNDYAQKRPLAGAMELEFCSIEADVFLVDGKLLVGHNRKDLSPDKTLDGMYLAPLAQAAKRNHGHVYPEPAEVILLVDIKEDGAAVYAELKRELTPYDRWLTHFRNGAAQPGAITVILSGERPTGVLAAESSRSAFIEGRPSDIDSNTYSKTLIPLVSEDWGNLFKWNGFGTMPADQRSALDAMVKKCHEQGRKLRFWATPETKAIWQTLYDAGVDLIGADRQKALADFLRERKKR